MRDYALRQGIETIRGRVDKLGVSEPTIIKKGTDIIVELPGLKPADFERIKSIIGRTAQLAVQDCRRRLGVHEEGRGHGAQGRRASPSSPTAGREKKTGKAHEDVYLRAKSRDALEKFFAGLTGELAVPPDREFGYEEHEARGNDGELAPDKYWRTYYCTGVPGVTGEYLANADVRPGLRRWARPRCSFKHGPQGRRR